jgi:TolA-binding protein
MKQKLSTFIFILTLLLLFSGCAVQNVEDAIDEIGIVTMDSLPAIEKAEQLYRELPEEQQGNVQNRQDLFLARDKYEQLESMIQETVDAIHAIGPVTLDSSEQIALARSKYDTLEKNNLTQYADKCYPILIDAEKQYTQLYTQSLYDSALEQYSQGEYIDAQAQLDILITDYPSADVIPQAKELIASCVISLARMDYSAGNYEIALNTLTTYTEQYNVTEEYTQLYEEIMGTLADIRPENGEILVNYIGSGEGEFTVNSDSSDACIKLESKNNPETYLLFYVHANSSATISVSDGEYIVKYTTGPHWYGTNSMFGEETSYVLAEDLFEFETSYTDEYIYYSTINITLYTVFGGNLETTIITADAF